MAIYAEHEDVLHSLQNALTAIGTLEPLDTPTTPPSRREFANMLRLAREFIGQMESQVALLATVSEDYLDEDYSLNENQITEGEYIS